MPTRILAMVLAGGEGKRLEPLTYHRAKPSVPFGGKYRIIDFVMSNFANSGIYNIAVLTQFKAESLIDHVEGSWMRYMGSIVGQVTINPAQQRVSKDWYLGTADAVFQNFHRVRKVNPELVAVFGGDHIYKMNIRQMINYHEQRSSDMSIAAIPVPVEKAAHTYGVMEVDESYNLIGFEEKPAEPKPMPDDPSRCLVSMGNYLFTRDVLEKAFETDHNKIYVGKEKLKELMEQDPDAWKLYSTHDIGYDIIPHLMKSGHKVHVYDFSMNPVPGVTGEEVGYWRDVGNLDEYFDANMDVCGIHPIFNLYNPEWPVHTAYHMLAPAKLSLASEVYNSIISEGCIVTRSKIVNTILGFDVWIEYGSNIEYSVINHGVRLGKGCRLNRAIVDKYAVIPPDTEIGVDHELDRQRGFTVSPNGITVVPKFFRMAGSENTEQ